MGERREFAGESPSPSGSCDAVGRRSGCGTLPSTRASVAHTKPRRDSAGHILEELRAPREQSSASCHRARRLRAGSLTVERFELVALFRREHSPQVARKDGTPWVEKRLTMRCSERRAALRFTLCDDFHTATASHAPPRPPSLILFSLGDTPRLVYNHASFRVCRESMPAPEMHALVGRSSMSSPSPAVWRSEGSTFCASPSFSAPVASPVSTVPRF